MIKHLKKGKQEGEKKEFLQQVKTTVETIIEDIEINGDKAVAQYSEKFDKWNPQSFKLSKDDIAKCYEQVEDSVIEDIKWAQAQVRNFAQIQRDSMKDVEVETLPGVTLGHKHIPMESVG